MCLLVLNTLLCDLDPIPTKLLYENLDVLLPTNHQRHHHFTGFWFCTTRLQNCYCQTPAQKKKKKKKKNSLDQNVLKNYRSISNLPFLSKILEKVVLHKLLAHLQENNLCNPFQSAYRTGHSTETALLRVVNDLLNAMDEDKTSVLLLLDLSAAFDTIDHQILFPVSELPLASALPPSSGFDRTFWTEINATMLLPLLLHSCLVFHRVPCRDLCCLFCTLLHFQVS